MTISQTSPIGTDRFRPLSRDEFNQYAKHLSKLTGDSLSRTRETLARIYGYLNVHEIEAVLSQPGVPGPFDDEIPAHALELQAVNDAIRQKTARALEIILEMGADIFDNGAPRPTIYQLFVLQLFSSPRAHRDGFRQLALPKTTSAERREKREAFLKGNSKESALIDVQISNDSNLEGLTIDDVCTGLPVMASAEARYGSVCVKYRKRKKLIMRNHSSKESEK